MEQQNAGRRSSEGGSLPRWLIPIVDCPPTDDDAVGSGVSTDRVQLEAHWEQAGVELESHRCGQSESGAGATVAGEERKERPGWGRRWGWQPGPD